jgi:hypothetical protein
MVQSLETEGWAIRTRTRHGAHSAFVPGRLAKGYAVKREPSRGHSASFLKGAA